MHYDYSTANILINKGLQIKIIDFGKSETYTKNMSIKKNNIST